MADSCSVANNNTTHAIPHRKFSFKIPHSQLLLSEWLWLLSMWIW